METAYAILFFMFGSVIGSFLNVMADRLPQEESIVIPPSRCPGCRRRLTAVDMIPVVSWLVLRGRCRSCGEKIPARVLWVEAVAGFAFAFLYIYFGLSPEFWLSVVYFSLLLAIFVIDLEEQVVLPMMVLIGIVISVSASVAADQFELVPTIMMSLAGGIVGAVLFFVIVRAANAYYRQEAMGQGDIWLGALAGFITGWPNVLVAAITSFILGGIIAVLLLALRVKKGKDAIGFGPFLALTTFVTFLWGSQFIDWYLGLFLN